ncbi:hypothetical protein J5N97_012616 [Dioscorea zingiberensis]|uniref:Uncharacterized protein n=1 Tax=Dioscorea zingiberensis TaxID=325984 RepID=A0A9D5CRD6_9LILI|nr:hypothetical protein J5N97_012616 [Dioscorea zingiberensis]
MHATQLDRLKECCRPICQPAIMEAALHISLGGTSTLDSNITRSATGTDVVNDCKSVVYAWLARELLPEDANSAFRILSGCKVNKEMSLPALPIAQNSGKSVLVDKTLIALVSYHGIKQFQPNMVLRY